MFILPPNIATARAAEPPAALDLQSPEVVYSGDGAAGLTMLTVDGDGDSVDGNANADIYERAVSGNPELQKEPFPEILNADLNPDADLHETVIWWSSRGKND